MATTSACDSFAQLCAQLPAIELPKMLRPSSRDWHPSTVSSAAWDVDALEGSASTVCTPATSGRAVGHDGSAPPSASSGSALKPPPC